MGEQTPWACAVLLLITPGPPASAARRAAFDETGQEQVEEQSWVAWLGKQKDFSIGGGAGSEARKRYKKSAEAALRRFS
jgi:hypothetical protein